MTTLIACTDCGARVPDVDGPTHRYIGGVPGCWAAYNDLQLRHYSDPTRGDSQLVVDTYAVQHPGVPSPQSCQSVAVHLVGLCLVLERGWRVGSTRDAMRQFIAAHKGTLPWLPPPPTFGPLTVLDALAAPDPVAYRQVVRAWAESVWAAWALQHAGVRAWADAVR